MPESPTGRAGRRLGEARALREQAEKEAMKAADGVRRIRRFVREGRLEPEELREARAEHEAAEAELERRRQRERQAEMDGALPESEEAVIEFLTNLRALVAGRITDVDGLDDALRTAFACTFKSFVLHSVSSGRLARLGPRAAGAALRSHVAASASVCLRMSEYATQPVEVLLTPRRPAVRVRGSLCIPSDALIATLEGTRTGPGERAAR
jgi:hypothetical protein